ncbi:methionine aminotransferase [Bacteroidota bacterium]
MIKSKYPNIGTSIFAVMSNMAKENNAINLSQGFPGFDCSKRLFELVNKYMKKGFNQYAPMEGVLALRERISEKTSTLHNHTYNPEKEINVTAGATQALFTAITAFIGEGDEVIIFEPAYDSYVPAIEMNGGQPVFVKLKQPDYHIPWDEVQRSITSKTKMIIINSPHNPTGTVLTEADIKNLQKIINSSGILILSDEVYEHIIFDNIQHESICRYPDLAERSIIVSSLSKTFNATGWKIGYCMAPENMMKEFRKVHQFQIYTVNHPVQHAIAEFLKKEDNYLYLSSFYQEKRDFFENLIKETKFKPLKSYGSYFQLVDYSYISDENDIIFAERLTKENKVASIPVSVFHHDKLDEKKLRFCFAKENELLEKAVKKLRKIS